MLPTYASSYVQHLLGVAARLGAERHVLLDYAALQEAPLRDPAFRVSQPQVLCLFQAASALTGAADLGLLVGEAVRPDDLHNLGYALMSCETVGDALNVNLRYQALVMGRGQFATDLSDDTVTVSWRPDGASPALLRPINESILASWVRYGQWITGSQATPMSVTFCHAKPKSLQTYHRVFQCALHFDGDTNSLTGPRYLLNIPLKQANPGLKKILLDTLEAQLQSGARLNTTGQHNDLVSQVKQALLLMLDQPGGHLLDVARTLHTSERTLKRRLAEQGTSVRALLQDIRLERARQQLLQPSTTVEAIAQSLGYRSATAFSQAFKRWQGVQPTTLRRLPR